MHSRSKELAKKLFTQTSDNLVNRISSSEFKCEDKQKYLVCKMYKYRQQSLFQKKKGMEDIQDTQHTNFPFIREAISKNYES